MSYAIYPGSFDPITLGHLNIIRRASKIFDNVVVCVMVNSGKVSPMFSLEERVGQIKRVVSRLPNVTVECSDELLVQFSERYEKPVIVKGLRAVSDFESEFQMALINKKMNHKVETLFLAASEKYTYLSSTMVKEMGKYGADLSEFVPHEILEEIVARTKSK